jgi:pimeloyl-ACP methyl ester carboxylesterase
MIAFAKENNARAVFDKMAPRLFCATTRESRPALVEEAARIAEPISTKTIVATLEALRDRPDARAGLAQIQVPTLVLVGEEDEVSPPVVAREMAGAIPNACLQVLAGAGHFAHLEQAEAWNDAVRKFALSIDS